MLSSFMMGGFECTYALADDMRKVRFDLLRDSKHEEYCRDDYRLIREVGASTVREGLAWHAIDKGDGSYDFSRFEAMMKIGQEEQVQQIWDLNHFDYPEYLDPFSDTFVQQFAEYGKRALHIFRKYIEGDLYIVPFNEISFYSWFGADAGWWAPFRRGSKNGFMFKKQLVKAALAAMKAIWEVDSSVHFIHVDPIMRRITHGKAPAKLKQETARFNNEIRYQAWDMIAGKIFPELGGDEKYLDIIGLNYYMVNQEWLVTSPETGKVHHIMIPLDHSDRISFADLIEEVFQRYHRPMIIAETGSHGEFRPGWWERILSEVEDALRKKLPIQGLCIYPTVDKPTSVPWLWPQSGLWDFYQLDPAYRREPAEASIDIIKRHLPVLDSLTNKVTPQRKLAGGLVGGIEFQ